MWLFMLFLAVPIVEIALFIQIGGLIGLWPTLAIVVLTAVLGTFLVRTQGALALSQLRGSFQRLNDPTEPLAHGAMILFAGALLLTPGFFTDAAGFALLIPAVRRAAFQFIKARITVQSFGYGDPRQTPRPGPRTRGDVIDGDYTEVDPPKTPTHPAPNNPSGWTRH
ncbi:FxsA family protein [Oceaniglobus ichthyenteri]|uniref:FxsA family protein n=1 Tax=Oceaniglobus ichthyenteri TaxID=2136177 RepID=UPI000D33ABCB|nr:FxsA family protein [Oceaniglobus ichthyenteri]